MTIKWRPNSVTDGGEMPMHYATLKELGLA